MLLKISISKYSCVYIIYKLIYHFPAKTVL